MYVQMKFHRKTPEEYWNMVVVPYRRRGVSGYVTNEDYIENPVQEPTYPYTWGVDKPAFRVSSLPVSSSD